MRYSNLDLESEMSMKRGKRMFLSIVVAFIIIII